MKLTRRGFFGAVAGMSVVPFIPSAVARTGPRYPRLTLAAQKFTDFYPHWRYVDDDQPVVVSEAIINGRETTFIRSGETP